MCGRSPMFLCDPQDPLVSFQNDSQYINNLRRYLSNLTDITQRNITATEQRYKSRFNTNRSRPMYQINDVVLVKSICSHH